MTIAEILSSKGAEVATIGSDALLSPILSGDADYVKRTLSPKPRKGIRCGGSSTKLSRGWGGARRPGAGR